MNSIDIYVFQKINVTNIKYGIVICIHNLEYTGSWTSNI